MANVKRIQAVQRDKHLNYNSAVSATRGCQISATAELQTLIDNLPIFVSISLNLGLRLVKFYFRGSANLFFYSESGTSPPNLSNSLLKGKAKWISCASHRLVF